MYTKSLISSLNMFGNSSRRIIAWVCTNGHSSLLQLRFFIDEKYAGEMFTRNEIQLVAPGDVYLGGSPDTIQLTDRHVREGFDGALTEVTFDLSINAKNIQNTSSPHKIYLWLRLFVGEILLNTGNTFRSICTSCLYTKYHQRWVPY